MKTQWRTFSLFTIVALFATAAEAQDKNAKHSFARSAAVVRINPNRRSRGSVVFLKNTDDTVRRQYTDDNGQLPLQRLDPNAIMKCTQKKTAQVSDAHHFDLTAARKFD